MSWFSLLDSEWNVLENAFEEWLKPSNFKTDGMQKSRLSDLTKRMLEDFS